MSVAQLLEDMAASLSDADLNAIRKARGFSAKETTSRNSFTSYFATSIGIPEALQSLTAEENVTLRLIAQTGEVDIPFFERLYGSAAHPDKPYYYGTYTQRYKPTFDAVKRNLVRKGLLVMAETKMRGETVQMERWRFALPLEFAAFLPPLVPTKSSDRPGETSDRTIRKKILQLVGGGPAIANDHIPIAIQQGSIWLGDQLFSAERLRTWQRLAWQKAMDAPQPSSKASLTPTEAAYRLLADLSPGEWAPASSLEPVLKIDCFGAKLPPVDRLMREGWNLGLLSRLEIDSTPYYRLSSDEQTADQDQPLARSLPWLEPSTRAGAAAAGAACKVDLRLIPFGQLDRLNALAELSVEGGALFASPSVIKLGRATPAERESPLAVWLAEAMPAFKEALSAVNQRWGKTLLHENLLVARVQDLSLRIQLERELGSDLVVLSEHFIAFAHESRSRVERVLKKTGFVVKTIRP